MTEAFDLANPGFLADPGPQLARMRAAGPLVPVRLPMIGTVQVATTHAGTSQILKDNDRFTIQKNGGAAAGFAWWMPKGLRLLSNNMLAKDDPEHRRLRKLVDRAFARRGMQDMRPRITACADGLLNGLDGRTDLVASYARRLPLRVVSDLLGVPETSRATFEARASALSEMGSAWGMVRMLSRVGGLVRVVRGIIREVEAAQAPGLILELLRQREEEDALTEDELAAMVFLLLFAGMETTTNLIAGSVVALEAAPDQKRWLLADPAGRAERAVEELCRFVSAVASTKPRFAAEATEVQGVPVAKGAAVMALPLAANRDPAVFADPDRLDLARFPNPHLAFATGNHFCLGMQLARIETQVALTRLYARFPDLALAQGQRPVYLKRPGHRAISHLHLDLAEPARFDRIG